MQQKLDPTGLYSTLVTTLQNYKKPELLSNNLDPTGLY